MCLLFCLKADLIHHRDTETQRIENIHHGMVGVWARFITRRDYLQASARQTIDPSENRKQTFSVSLSLCGEPGS